MSSKLLTLAFLSLTGSALGQLASCDGLLFPDWDACDEALDISGWRGNYETLINNECREVCHSFSNGNDKNCRFSVCFATTQCVGQTANNLVTYYGVIDEWCRPRQTGGRYDFNNDGFFEVRNNPDYVGDSSVEMAKRALNIEKRGNVTITTVTLEDYEELRAEEEEAMRHELAIEQGREEALIEKRQDDSFKVILEFTAIARPGERRLVSQEMSSGVTETWSFTESISIGVSVTTEVGASFFDLFSASVSFEVSAETSFSVTSGMSYTSGNCPRSARVYWEPLYNMAEGYLESDPDTYIEVWAPRGLNGEAEGRFVTQCLG